MDILKELASIKKTLTVFLLFIIDIALINQLHIWLVLYVRLCKGKSNYLSTAKLFLKKMSEFCSQES